MITLDTHTAKATAQRDLHDATEMFNIFLESLETFVRAIQHDSGGDITTNLFALMTVRDNLIVQICALRALLNYERVSTDGATEKRS